MLHRLPSLTFLHAGEREGVLAHEVVGRAEAVVPDGEADQGQLGNADGEVHGGVPLGVERCAETHQQVFNTVAFSCSVQVS